MNDWLEQSFGSTCNHTLPHLIALDQGKRGGKSLGIETSLIRETSRGTDGKGNVTLILPGYRMRTQSLVAGYEEGDT